MARADFEEIMRRRIQDMQFAIEKIRERLARSDDHDKVELAARLSDLERRQQQMEKQLHTLEKQPDSLWSNLKTQIELEWFALIDDFEDRVGRLR